MFILLAGAELAARYQSLTIQLTLQEQQLLGTPHHVDTFERANLVIVPHAVVEHFNRVDSLVHWMRWSDRVSQISDDCHAGSVNGRPWCGQHRRLLQPQLWPIPTRRPSGAVERGDTHLRTRYRRELYVKKRVISLAPQVTPAVDHSTEPTRVEIGIVARSAH